MALVRARGYSIVILGERVANASGVAVPIFGASNRVVGCLAPTIPNMRYAKRDGGRLASIMKAEGGKLSRCWGRTGPSTHALRATFCSIQARRDVASTAPAR